MKNRSGMQKMASVYVADLRQELKEGNRSILNRHLQELMEDRLEKQEQIMLFLNRRGYAGFLFLQRVRPCGKVSALRCFAVVSTETERWSVITADMKNQGHPSVRSAVPDISENFGQEHSRSKTL